ncbi:Lrp/AsnC family transcriptional regulator [Streptomyces sp. NPDC060011]|uniref:Lrp/AsnC family transcriptional regulator n=2 Tax=Streptomyces TaxID=1883 RepID=UPI00224D0FB1|nr:MULTISPECIES: Lrp/AsnC family transcriptional regulator [unclassified Streptomyces]MCX4917144.1 Lrp/AsnC family transcriptional regulator [Streptomyces sp. NBC_00687]MCX5130755.1 Lrp/AsnC family transcriptional regulator [Streptomyces sp. NBC_00340]MCX5279221.1 Lrp/AsnC family transcriptional regulator [Streptomyces sp. NBC_00198]WSD77466.1 Lrp/AsnC family transcriptional regulator [Streptomyces sp. NBC_01558]
MGDPAVTPKEPRQARAAATGTPVGFDALDRQILELLQRDGRIKLSELGRRVMLSPAAVAERVRRLESSGAVTGYAAHVSASRLGYGIQAFIRVNPHGGYTLGHPRTRELLARPEIIEAHHVVGEDCWILKAAVEDTLHLEAVLEQASALGRTTTSIVLSSPVDRKPLLPPAAP